MTSPANIEEAQVVLPCEELGPTLAFFTGPLGFRLDAIHPADDPRVAVISGHGLRLRLERGAAIAPGTLRLSCLDPSVEAGEVTAPNGTRILFVKADPTTAMPPLRSSFVLSRARDARSIEGRAGMRYRDLLPDRYGGALIASHIAIPGGGPVPDYVHFHAVAFQMIYCAKGWVRVVYEDQGDPFVLHEGDCALQPPRVRHRVLESSPGLEVVEVSSPAEHVTFADHDLALPTSVARPDRDFGGQHFVRHEAHLATYQPWTQRGFEARDLGIAAATAGRVQVRVVRVCGSNAPVRHPETPDLQFGFVLSGEAALRVDGRRPESLGRADAFCIPRGATFTLEGATTTFELLEVVVPDYGCLAVP